MAKYQQYEEYKNSGIEWLGKIPHGWKVLRGKYVFQEFRERSTTGEEVLLSVSEYYGVKPRSEKISEGDHLSRAESLVDYKKCYKNDLVMNIMLAWKRGLGVSKYDGIVSPAYSVFRFNKDIHPYFMHHLFRTDLYTSHFKTRSTGVIDSRLRLYPESFLDTEILIPSYDEQAQIANFLDHETAQIDTLIDKQQTLIQLLKEKRQAVISHAVTKGLNPDAPMKDSGVEWLGEVPEHWNVAGFKKYLNSIIDYRGKTPEKVDSGKFLVTARNIKKGEINYEASQEYVSEKDYPQVMSRGIPEIGDVLFTTEAPLGEVAQVDKTDIALAQRIIKFSGQNGILDNTYLKFYIMSNAFQDSLMTFATGSTALGIKSDRLSYLRQLIPPLKEQLLITEHIERNLKTFDVLMMKAEQAIQLMQERRTALISAAVTGKIDVRGWQAPDSEAL